MKIPKKIKLDFGGDTAPETVFAKQNDVDSRYIVITPTVNGRPVEIEDGTTTRLQLTKPDKHTVINDCTIVKGKIIAELTGQCLTAAGIAIAEIGLYKGSTLLSSQTFKIDIKKSAYDSSAPESSDEYNSFVGLMNEATAAAEGANAAAINANNAAAEVRAAIEAIPDFGDLPSGGGSGGPQGPPGEKGDPGYTPIKGLDYFTPADILEIIKQIPPAETDATLSESGKAANAKAVGDVVLTLANDIKQKLTSPELPGTNGQILFFDEEKPYWGNAPIGSSGSGVSEEWELLDTLTMAEDLVEFQFAKVCDYKKIRVFWARTYNSSVTGNNWFGIYPQGWSNVYNNFFQRSCDAKSANTFYEFEYDSGFAKLSTFASNNIQATVNVNTIIVPTNDYDEQMYYGLRLAKNDGLGTMYVYGVRRNSENSLKDISAALDTLNTILGVTE